jgi:hypothetical protein
MAEPENIVRFQEMVVAVLGELYSVHPGDIEWSAASFYGNKVPSDDEEDLFDNTVRYLLDNGYVFESQGYIRLNAKSWSVLKKPDPLHPAQSLGSTLKSWAKDAASGSGKELVSTLGGTALSEIAKALNLPF